MRLALLTFAVIALGSAPAFADDVVILPPLGSGAAQVSAALTKGSGVTLAALKVDANCASDPKRRGKCCAGRSPLGARVASAAAS